MGFTSSLKSFHRPSKNLSSSASSPSSSSNASTTAPASQPHEPIPSNDGGSTSYDPPSTPIPSKLCITFSKRHKVPSVITNPYTTTPIYLLDTQTILPPHVNLLRASPSPLSIGTCTFPQKGNETTCVVHDTGFIAKPRSKVDSDWIFPSVSGGQYVVSGSRHGLDIKDESGVEVAVLNIFTEKNKEQEMEQKGTFMYWKAGLALGDLEKERLLFVAFAVAEHKKATNAKWWAQFGTTGYWAALGPGGI